MDETQNVNNFHTLTVIETVEILKTDLKTGLFVEEVEKRRVQYGENKLIGDAGVSWFKVMINQFLNILVLILIGASILSFVVKDYAEAAVILIIVFLNAAIGFVQEFKAEKTVESLKKMTSPSSQVLRNSEFVSLPTSELVPGDIIALNSGDVVGADCRIFETVNLETDEALLTGEALPIPKNHELVCKLDDSVGDRLNLVYSSTIVTKGRAQAIVYATGMTTEVGKIAKKLMATDKKQKTKLNRSLDRMALVLLTISGLLALVVFATNKFKLDPEIVLYAVSLAIAVIPEGLVAVVTLTMAIGVRQLSKQQALVRQLNSIETLGSVTDICSDKTGTLTQSKMVLVRAWAPSDGIFTIDGLGLEPIGSVYRTPNPLESSITISGIKDQHELITSDNISQSFALLTKAAALCNNAEIKFDKEKGEWYNTGDPTETALQVFATKLEMSKLNLIEHKGYKILAEFPFDSGVKRMTVIVQTPDNQKIAFLKGATERVVDSCTHIQNGESIKPISSESLYNFVEPQIEKMAGDGLRVISLAYRIIEDHVITDSFDNLDREDIEKDFTYIGIVGIYDPPRPESRSSVEKCHQAGIVVRMLTGDHPATATAIAKQVGILQSIHNENPKQGDSTTVQVEQLVMTARDFDAMTTDQIDAMPELPLVIARCTPETKVKLIEALHRRKAIVAMTGDGVNDSPSLKFADVGIAMGMTGSDVAKQASSIILTDDNFSTIVRAVAEGRRMFSNIVRFTIELIGSNVAELVCLTIGLVFKDTNGYSVFPLSPVAILTNNMLTGTPPAMALGTEKALPDNMTNPPRDPLKGLFTAEVVCDLIVQGTFIGGLSITAYWLRLNVFGDGQLGARCNLEFNETCNTVFKARGVNFACLTLLILNFAYSCRDTRRQTLSLSMIKRVFENKGLAFSYLSAWIITFIALYVPVLNEKIFKHHPISWEWGIVFVSFVLYFIFDAIYKYVKRYIFRPNHVVTEMQAQLQNNANRNMIKEL
ncbi:hypothetical protein BB561_005337 [Smittium simulii]|uniref:P-type Na(+) transporter n=1 Tax=Smittium simulii TaxID=133385 RepID=A0A2T9YAV3_9FUNG|nr:hypothetical protein BB561_005337 [Smittium simulii]